MSLRLLALLVVLVAAAPAGAATPTVRVHGTEAWTPVMDVALDEVAMLWTGVPRQEKTPPVLVDGTSVLSVSKDSAAIRLSGVTTLEELALRARALRDANPAWDTRLVLYTTGTKRNSKSRRLLTEEIAVVAGDGTVSREHATDPLNTLELARARAQRPGVSSVEPVAEAPDYLKARLKRKLAKLKRQDQPNERQEFFTEKRVSPGETTLPVERYLQARDHMRFMPVHSTAAGNILFPSTAALGLDFPTAAAFLGAWTPLGPGNIGGRTRAIVINPVSPNTMYAGGVAGGVWKTTDGGASWTPLTDTMLPNLAIGSLAIDPTNPQILYAGTGEGVFNGDAVRGAGIFKTTDGGTSWNQLASTASTDFNFVNKIRVLPDGTTVLAATRTGLYRSVDSGTTWSQVISASDVSGCFDIAGAPAYVLASCGTFAQGTVYRSNSADASVAFLPVLGKSGSTLVVLTMGRTSIAIAPSNPNIAYALASSTVGGSGGSFNLGLDAVYKSTNAGVSWAPVVRNTSPTPLNTLLLTNPVYATPDCFGFTSFFNQGWYDNALAIDPVDPNRVWAGGIDLFRSDDGGANFRLASFWWTDSADPPFGNGPGAFAHADQHTIVFHPSYNGTTNQIMFVGNDGGIFKTTSARGAVTSNACDPDQPVSLSGRWTDVNNNYGVTQFYHGLPYPGPDGGNTFLGGTQDNGTVRGSTAGGIGGWAQINGGDGGYVAVDSSNSNIVYTETTNLSLVKSTDGGASFTDATANIVDDGGFAFITPFTMSPNNPQTLWIGGFALWRTTNAAASWAQASTSLGCGKVSAIAVAPNHGAPGGVGDNLVMVGTSNGCVFRSAAALSTNGGTTWTSIPTAGSGFVSWIAFDPSDASNVYVTHSSFNVGHVFKSTDAGLTFTDIDGSGATAIPDVPAHSVVVAPGNANRLYVGTDLGVFSSDDGGDSWAVENTGFANVITEALAVGQVGGVDHLFAFTHGRGVFRVPLPIALADIAATVATVPAGMTVAPGANVSVSNTIRNVGGQTSPTFLVDFTLVPVDGGGNPIGGDLSLGVTRTAGPLAPNVSSAATTSVRIPPGTAPGSYKIRVRGDVDHDVTDDTNLANNTKLTGSVVVAIPDLAVNSVTFTPAASGAGQTVSVTHTLRNLAVTPGNAPASVSGIYLATNTSFSTVVAQLGAASAPALAANAAGTAVSGNITMSLPIPPAGMVPPGRYFVVVRANDDNDFVEASTANNVGASGTRLVIGPDLLFTSGSTPTGASPGSNISATYTVRNQGGVGATFSVGFALVPVNASGTPTGMPDITVGPTSTAVVLNAGITSGSLSSTVFLPADLAMGTYKLRFIADPANAVIEADETNNTFLSTSILSVVRPDLSVPSVTFTPASSRANGSVTVTHAVRNLSPAPGAAPPSVSNLFLSSANTSVAGAIALGSVNVGQIPGAGTATVTKIATIPPGTPAGLYFVLAQADAPGAIMEPNEANNLGSSTTRLVVGPDLSITAGSAGAAVAPGSNLSVTYTLKNGGGETATGFTVGFTLVPVAPAGSDITLAATRAIASLAAGGMQAFTDGVLIPSDAAAGTYRVRITADTTGAVTEADEGNNTFLTGTVTVARPNLTVTSVTFTPPATRANGSLTVTHAVRNLAAAPGTAAPTVSSLFLNSVNTSVTGGIFLGNVSAPQLLAASTATLVKPITVPPGTPPGLYFVLALADAGDTLLEPNEANNLGVSATRVLIGPDLTVTAASTAAGGSAGTNLGVTYTLKNAGGDLASNFDVGFALVPVTAAGVPTGDPDIPVGPTRTAVTLAAGVTQAFTGNVLLPAATAPGNYKVRVIADSGATVSEAIESNNTLLTALVKIARADLTVPSVTFTPAAVASGGNVSVSHAVKNLTALNGSAPPSQSAIYLSQNASFDGVLPPALGTANVPALAPGAVTTLTRTVNVGTLATGVYFFVVRADDPGSLVEQAEGNNIGVSAGLLVGPDAAVSAASTGVTGAGPGTNVSVSYTLRNLGAVATGTFNVDFDVTPVTAGGVPNGAPVALGTVRSNLSLLAAQTLSFANNALLPAGLAAGSYRIGVTVGGFSIADANPANNRLLTSGVLQVLRPDLIVSSISVTPSAVAVGGNVSATHAVRNTTATIGNAPASLSSLVLSTNASASGVFFTYPTNVPVPALLPGATSAAITTLLPLGAAGPNLAPGKYFVGVMADAPGVIVEANEGNNVLFAATPVRVGPDPAVTAASLTPAGVVPGTNVSVTRTLTNLSASPTGTFTVDYVLEPIDPNGPPDVTLLRVNEPSLGAVGSASATRSGTVSLAIPPGTAAGQYKILVVVDADGTFAEADKANNAGVTSAFSVLLPDLVMSVFTPPATLIAGRSAALTNTVRNNTAAPATSGPFEIGVYFSMDATIDTLSDTLLGARSVVSLGGSSASSIPVTITVPSVMGNVFLGAVADHLNAVVEANESNNVTIRPVAVVPDLTAGRVTPVVASITFNISGSPPACLVSIIGGGTTSQKITAQTGGAFSGGQMQFADSQGGTNTIGFSGTVFADGTLNGTFSLSRVNGGGGTGSGTLTGTAGLGSPGSLSLSLTGTFTVSGGGTCPLTATVTFP